MFSDSFLGFIMFCLMAGFIVFVLVAFGWILIPVFFVFLAFLFVYKLIYAIY